MKKLLLIPIIILAGCATLSDVIGIYWPDQTTTGTNDVPVVTNTPPSVTNAPPRPDPPKPDVVPVTDNGSLVEPVDLSKAKWVGRASNCQKVAPSVTAKGGTISGGSVRISCDRKGWPEMVEKKTVNAGVCIFWQRDDGQWEGGFFEWVKPNDTVRGMNNLGSPKFMGGYIPKAGQPVTFCLASIDWKRRSTSTPPVKWPAK